MLVNGDATAVVLDGDAAVLVDGHLDVCAVAGHGLVDAVVHRLVHQVVQALLADVANIHGGALAYGLKAFQHLYVTCGIVVFFLGRGLIALVLSQFVCHFYYGFRNSDAKVAKKIQTKE